MANLKQHNQLLFKYLETYRKFLTSFKKGGIRTEDFDKLARSLTEQRSRLTKIIFIEREE